MFFYLCRVVTGRFVPRKNREFCCGVKSGLFSVSRPGRMPIGKSCSDTVGCVCSQQCTTRHPRPWRAVWGRLLAWGRREAGRIKFFRKAGRTVGESGVPGSRQEPGNFPCRTECPHAVHARRRSGSLGRCQGESRIGRSANCGREGVRFPGEGMAFRCNYPGN